MAEEIADDHCIHQLAFDEDALIGYCKMRYPSWYTEHSDAADPIALGQLYTDPDRIGEGIGAALMEWALAEARQRGHDAVQLSVYSENYGAQRFYARYGFVKIADTFGCMTSRFYFTSKVAHLCRIAKISQDKVTIFLDHDVLPMEISIQDVVFF